MSGFGAFQLFSTEIQCLSKNVIDVNDFEQIILFEIDPNQLK